MAKIPLTQGQVAIVDDDDFERVSSHKWFATKQRNGNYYAGRMSRCNRNNRKTIYMHDEILGTRNGLNVDHVNGDTLLNTKNNLRFCTATQNSHNRKKNKNGSSRFKGVSWDPDSKKWKASIRIAKRLFNLGRFSMEDLAARSYDAAARKNFGGFARVNFPLRGEMAAL